jgi:hypothetical protein
LILNEPVAFFLLIMAIILVTPLLSERVRLPGTIGIILGGMLTGPHGLRLIEAGEGCSCLRFNGTQCVAFILSPNVVAQIVLRAEQSLASPLDTDGYIDTLKDQLKSAMLEQGNIGSFIVVRGFGSRKRVADTLANLPERLAASFDGNLAILHFDN